MRPTTRRTPVPGHARRGPRREDAFGWACACACGWSSKKVVTADGAVDEHTGHKAAVLSGEWAALFESGVRADVERRAEPLDLIDEVNARIDARGRELITEIRRDRTTCDT